MIEKLSGRPLTPELKSEVEKVDDAKSVIAFLEKVFDKKLSDELKASIESNFSEKEGKVHSEDNNKKEKKEKPGQK